MMEGKIKTWTEKERMKKLKNLKKKNGRIKYI
jgi:hypothetical protein